MRELSRNSSGKIEIVSERYRKSSGVSGKSRGTLEAPERSRKVLECSRIFWNVPECLVGCPFGLAQEGAATWPNIGKPKRGAATWAKRGRPKRGRPNCLGGKERGAALIPYPLIPWWQPLISLSLGGSPLSPYPFPYIKGRRCSPKNTDLAAAFLLPLSEDSLQALRLLHHHL
jgi:hypothetical protein